MEDKVRKGRGRSTGVFSFISRIPYSFMVVFNEDDGVPCSPITCSFHAGKKEKVQVNCNMYRKPHQIRFFFLQKHGRQIGSDVSWNITRYPIHRTRQVVYSGIVEEKMKRDAEIACPEIQGFLLPSPPLFRRFSFHLPTSTSAQCPRKSNQQCHSEEERMDLLLTCAPSDSLDRGNM